MAVNHLKIRIEAEGRDAEQVIGHIRQQLGGLEKSAEKAGQKTRQAGNMITGAIRDIASEAGLLMSTGATFMMLVHESEQYAKSLYQTRMVFGQMAEEIIAKSRQMAEAVGYAFTSTEIQYAFRKIHDSLERYGLDVEQQSQIIQRAMDIAASRGLNLAETIDRVESAMRGEAEASEYLGLTLNDTYMKNQALDGSLKDVWQSLTDGEKAQYRYLEFLQQSEKYAGAAKDATYSLGQELKNTFNEIVESVGPAIAELNHGLAQLIHSLREAQNEAYKFSKEKFPLEGGGIPLNPGLTQDAYEKSIRLAMGGNSGINAKAQAQRALSEAKGVASQIVNEIRDVEFASAQDIARIDRWLESQRIALLKDSVAKRIALIREEGQRMLALTKGDAFKRAQIEAMIQERIVAVRQEAIEKEVEEQKRQAAVIKESYEAAKAFIDVHSQTDVVAMAIERLKQQYDELEEAIWSAFEAGVIGADEAWKAMDELSMAQENDTARIIKSHRRAAEETSEAWKNAYNQITNFLEDWLSGSRSLVKSFVDWLRHLVAQIAATNIVGAFAAGMGLPGAAAWAGQGGLAMTGGAGGSGSILENLTSLTGIYNMVSGGLSGMGNFLMYGVPEKLLDMGAVEPAWLLGNLSPDVMGGLTAGFGTFLLQGFLGGDWGRAAVSGASTGLGAWGGATIGAMTSIGGPIGAALGAIGGGLVGKVLGGLFGDGTERTYLTQGFSFGYSPELGLQFGEPVTMRKEHGTPDMMDAIFKTQDQLMQGFKQTFDTTIDMLEKITPGIKEEFRGWGRDQSNPFTLYWSAENDKELKHDTELNIRRFSIEFMQPLVDTFKKDFKGEIQGLDLHLFTDDFKKRLGDGIEDAFSQIDFTKVESLDDLNEQLDRLGKVAQGVKELENYVEQVQRLDRAYKLATGKLDKYHASLEDINSQYEAQMQALEAMGVDLEQMPEFFEAWDKSINDLKEKIFGFVLDVPEKFDEHWQRIIKSISELDIGGKMVELINRSLEDPSALSNVGQQWAQWLGDSMKSAILSESMDMLMGQISNAYIQPIMQSFIGQAFSADSIMGAFTQIDQAIPALSQAGQSLAEVFSFIQRTGNLEGFDWSGWKEKYGGVWDEINQKNQEAAKTMELAAETHKESAKAHLEAAGALKESAAAIEAGAERLQAPPPVNVTVVAAPEATLG